MGAYRRRTLGISLLVFAASAGPTALAQESGGLTTTASFAQRFELSDNPDGRLNSQNDGQTFLSRTSLSFGLASETQSSRLAFDVGASLKYVLSTSSTFPIREGLADPFASLLYETENRNSRLDFFARYSQSDVGDLSEVIDPTGTDLILDTGQVERYVLTFGYETGLSAPIGFEFDAGYFQRNYFDTTDPELNDTETITLDAALRFSITQTLDARLLLGYRQENEQGVPSIDRKIYSAGFGLDYDISETQELGFRLTSDRIDTDREFSDTTIEDREEGYSAGIDYEQELSNGRFAVALSSDIESTGRRSTLTFDRDYEFARGGLELRLGATENARVGAQPLARIRLRRDLPTGAVVLTYDDIQRTDIDDFEYRDRVLTLRVDQDISETSSWGLLAGYADTKSLDDLGSDRQRSQFQVDYRRALTRDWDILAGYEYEDATTNNASRRTENTLFFTLVRDFEARP